MTWRSTLKGSRREWDSNPRYPFEYARLPSVYLRPLGHLSLRHGWREVGAGTDAVSADQGPRTALRKHAPPGGPHARETARGESGIRTHGALTGSTVFE